jgi:hypothetical protein
VALELRPLSMEEAKQVVGRWHRHNRPPLGGLFAVGVASGGELCGVAVVGRPVARMLQDGRTCEITRLATDGTYNACSKLYAACRDAAKALGYRRVYTYTLQSESGASLRAAGFAVDEELEARASWDCAARNRVQTDLFGVAQRPPEAKIRWVWPASERKTQP